MTTQPLPPEPFVPYARPYELELAAFDRFAKYGQAATVKSVVGLLYAGSRTTVGKYHGGREGMFAAATRLAGGFWAQAADHAVEGLDDPEEKAAAIFEATVDTTVPPGAHPQAPWLDGYGWLTMPVQARAAFRGTAADAAEQVVAAVRARFNRHVSRRRRMVDALTHLLCGAVLDAAGHSHQPIEDAADAARDIVLGWRR